ncbi:hypothetical protein [Rhodococcus ruber]|uniref:hypothetical protein n=1 Tax=Rhodococcus ruber TaxID=1830 RepID=UPI00315C8865
MALSGPTDRREETIRWYTEGLGFLDAGGTTFAGADMAEVQGINHPTVDFDLDWVVDRSEFMQLELFAYRQPTPRPKRRDRSPADVGYSVLCIHVLDFDGTLARLAELGTTPLGPVLGARGDRHVTVEDPAGAQIELFERDIQLGNAVETALRPEVNAAVRGVRLTVLDPARTDIWLTEVLGLRRLSDSVHGDEHRTLWNVPEEAGASTVVAYTDARSFIEVVSYERGSADWPADYQLSDQGILNIALGTPDRDTYFAVRTRVEEGPYVLNRHLVLADDLEADYALDDQGFSVELIYMEPAQYQNFGFRPRTVHEA